MDEAFRALSGETIGLRTGGVEELKPGSCSREIDGVEGQNTAVDISAS